jgi:hypothetical protein
VPPRDFDAAFAEVQRQFDEGEIDGDKFQKDTRAITKEEAQFTARMTVWEENQQTAAEQSASDFNAAAVTWEKANADFMANPLRAQAMQQAINAVAAKSPSLAPSALFTAAAKVAFEAFGYTPPAAAEPVAEAAAIAAATAARKPTGVPVTLASAPAAAPIEAPATNSAYDALDSKDIDSLEDAVARMSPDQLDAYLGSAPGAKSTGIPG